jgi:hypothetical protein
MPEFHDRRTGETNELNKPFTLVTHGILHPNPEYVEGAKDEYSLAPTTSGHDSMDSAHKAAGEHYKSTGFTTRYEILDSKAHPFADAKFTGRTDYPGTSEEDLKKISQRPSWS